MEWAEKVEPALPPEYLRIDIEVLDENRRRFKLTAMGERHKELLTESNGS